MSTKHKAYDVAKLRSNRRQLVLAREAHAKGKICSEDFIWMAMQCYAAENRSKK